MPSKSVHPYAEGDPIRLEDFTTINGSTVSPPPVGQVVHIQFLRFAGCPVCNLHLRAFVQRRIEVEREGIHEVLVFHSTVEELREYENDLPFDVVADPRRLLYTKFGVETSQHPYGRAFLPMLPKVAGNLLIQILRRKRKAPSRSPEGGMNGLPADILVGHDSRVIAIKYGVTAYDQWSVEEVTSIAGAATRT